MSHDHVTNHYRITDLEQRILTALEAAGKDLEELTVDDLAPVDAFHIRGRAGTEELAQWADVNSNHRVLDVGSGIGGTGRYLAATTGCHVSGVDLTEDYCQIANSLSRRVGLSDRTKFRQGSALELPFDDASFDVVWTEHVQMNIADKATFYAQIARVLKPGGLFAFHDIYASPTHDVFLFPVPWAFDQSISHLIAVSELESILADVGLEAVRWEDKTEAATTFFQTVLERNKREGPPPVGLHLIMGESGKTKFTNLLQNLEANRLQIVQAVMRKG